MCRRIELPISSVGATLEVSGKHPLEKAALMSPVPPRRSLMLPYSEIQTLSLQLLHVERSPNVQELTLVDYEIVSEKER